MLHGFNFSKLVLLSTLIFTYSNASNSQFSISGTSGVFMPKGAQGKV